MTARQRRAIAGHIEALANVKTRSRAERLLERYGPLAVPALIDACLDARPEIRFSAAWTLGFIGDGRAFDSLVRLSDDPVDEVRYDAQWALGHLGDPRAIDFLIEKGREEPDGGAWYGLRLFGPSIAFRFIEMLGDRDPHMVTGAIDVLWRTVPERAEELFSRLLEHSEEVVRSVAADALELAREYPNGHWKTEPRR